MLDFSWSELLVVIAIAVLVIGPQDIPKTMRAMGRVVRRIQYVKFALSRQFEDMMKDADLLELRDSNAAKPEALSETDEAASDTETYDNGEKGGDDDATRH